MKLGLDISAEDLRPPQSRSRHERNGVLVSLERWNSHVACLRLSSATEDSG